MDRRSIDVSHYFASTILKDISTGESAVAVAIDESVPLMTYDQVAVRLDASSARDRSYVSLEDKINQIDSSIQDIIDNMVIIDTQQIKIGNSTYTLAIDSSTHLLRINI